MKSQCHSCGREYLTARALAGQAIACRSCGALNDGAGGPPPAQGEPKRRAEIERRDPATGSRGARSGGEQRIKSGAAFTIGSTPKPADPAKLAEIEVGAMREKLAVAESAQGWRGSRVVFALGIGAASVTALVTAGIFIYRAMVMPEAGIDWAPMQRAVAGIDTPLGDGSAFVVESKGDLWLVTSFQVIGAAPEVTATFRDPTTGAEVLRLPGLRSKDVWVSKRFFGRATGLPRTNDDASSDDASSDDAVSDESVEDGAPHFTIAAANIEMYRPQIEALGIAPLALASGGDVRAGVDVVAMGHTIARNDDGVQQGAAAHALFDGTVSARKNPPSGPAYLQTSAQFEEGCAGGPLFLKSTQEVAGVQLDPWLTADRRLVLLADEIADVTENGVQLGALRKTVDAAALRQTGTAEGVKEAVEWPLFPEFEAEIIALEAEGWRIRAQEIVVTGADGLAVLTHAVTSPPNAQVALAVLSREAVVPIEIGPFESAAGSMTAHRVGGDAWSSSIVVATDASRSTFVSIPTATRVAVAIRTTFLGQPIRGRVVYVFLERDPSTAPTSVPQGNPQGNSPTPSPGVPAVPNPSQPPAQSPGSSTSPTAVPAATPSATSPASPPATPVSAPSPSAGGLASIVEFDPNYCNPEVFASSILGLTTFDEKWLSIDPVTGDKNLQPLVEALGAELDPNGNDDPQIALMKNVRRASLGYSATNFLSSRPVFNTVFRGIPNGTKVAVYAEVRPHGQLELIPTGRQLLVSASSDTIPSDLGGSVPLAFPWNQDRLHQLRAPVDISVELIAKYEDGTEDRGVEQFRVLPPSDVEQEYPCGLSWAAMVDETHPYIRTIINRINQDPKLVREGVSLTGTGGDAKDQLLSAYLVWDELVRRGLRYQNLPGTSVTNAQRVRSVHESLCDRNANCLDGAVLFASFLRAIGFDSVIVLLPTHALVAVQISGGPPLFIETTVLGTPVASDPRTPYDALFRQLTSAHPFVRNEPTLSQFEQACAIGFEAVKSGLMEAERALERWNVVAAQGDPQLPDGSWRPEAKRALADLSNQLLVVQLSQARHLGVRPIGVPPDLEQRYPLPK